MALNGLDRASVYSGWEVIMRTYTADDFKGELLSIGDQTDHFVMIHHKIGIVTLGDLEFLLSIGLECCGVTPSLNMTATICCCKTE